MCLILQVTERAASALRTIGGTNPESGDVVSILDRQVATATEVGTEPFDQRLENERGAPPGKTSPVLCACRRHCP